MERKIIQQVLDDLDQIYNEIKINLSKFQLQYIKHDVPEYIFLTMLVIFENAFTILGIFKHGITRSAKIIARSSLEAYINIAYVKKFKNEGLNNILLSSHEETSKFIKKTIENLPHADENVEFKRYLNDAEKKISKLRTQSAKNHDIATKFNKSNNGIPYIIYRFLCQTSHNSKFSNIDRFMNKDRDGKRNITIFNSLSEESQMIILSISIYTLKQSYIDFQDILQEYNKDCKPNLGPISDFNSGNNYDL